jgi:cytochrome c5
MKTNMILTMSVIAVLTVACSKSDDEAAKSATESMGDKASNAVTEMKDTTTKAAETVMEKGKEVKEVVTEKTKSAAEVASTFVKKGSTKVVETVDEAKEGLSETVDNVKEKAASMLADNSTQDMAAESDKAGSATTMDSVKEKASSMLSDSSAGKTLAESGTVATAMETTAQITAMPAADLEAGKSVYTSKCVACHGSGAAGAPKLDDSSWAARKAQGMDVLLDHAIKGYQGPKGYMPAKGGFAALSDEEVTAAVAYMLSAIK